LVLHQDVELLGQQADCLLEVQVLLFHDKGDAITAPVASEAVIEALVQVNREGWGVFVVERTEPFHAGTSVLGQFDVLPHNGLDGKFPDLVYGGLADHNMRSLSQQSRMDWPEYFRRREVIGLMGCM